jgi:sulfofructose kinase
MSNQPSATTIPRFDVVGLGLNAMDYITVLGQFPKPYTKLPIQEVRLEPGGQVATALATCCRLGLTGSYIGSVGSDHLGTIQMESLRQEGIDTSFVRTVDGATSQMAFVLVEEGVGERTILWHRDPRLIFPPAALTREMVTAGRILHLDGRDSAAALQAARWAGEADIPIVIDIDQIYDQTTPELLALVDYLVAAEDFARDLTGHDDEELAVKELAARFPRAMTGITLGARGAIFLHEGQILRSPAFDVEVRDTTGAGDVFHGAFIYGVLKGWGLQKNVRFANATAAMKCTQLGARTGIPSLSGVEVFLETARERKADSAKK